MEDIDLELNDRQLLDFDQDEKTKKDNFPMDDSWTFENEAQRRRRKFVIFQLAHDDIPAELWLWVEQFNFDMNEKQMLDTFNLYDKYITAWGNEAKMDMNMLHFLTCSMYDNHNLLMDLVDIYKRDTLEEMMKEQEQDKSKNIDTDVVNQITDGEGKRFERWLEKYEISKRLQQKYDNHKINYMKELEQKIAETVSTGKIAGNSKKDELSFQSAILSYIKRVGQRLILNSNLIPDDLNKVSTIIRISREFVDLIGIPESMQKQQLSSPPFLVDFMILFPPSVRDEKTPRPGDNNNDDDKKDSDDDDDDNDEYSKNIDKSQEEVIYGTDIIGDIEAHFKKKNIVYEIKKIDYPAELVPLRQKMKECFKDFKAKLKNIDTKTYPQFKRVNVIFDRRDKNKQALIIFQPPDTCDTIPNELIPPEYYFDLSRRCLIPRSGMFALYDK